jgi:hypothetical protein
MEHSMHQVLELESKLAELRSHLPELPPTYSPEESSEAEEWLQTELENLQNSCRPRCRRTRAFVS